MNLNQVVSILRRAAAARMDHPVKSIREVKIDEPETSKAKKKAAFLRAFAKNGSITGSARLARIDRTTHYEWFAKDAKYKAAFESKVQMAVDSSMDELYRLSVEGVFKPLIYKGKLCYASRIRILCQLADGTSAFQDELPKGAKVTGTRMVEAHDGEILGRTKYSATALLKRAAVLMPEKYGRAARRERKPPAR